MAPVPHGREPLSPGDAALTRRVKAAGEHSLVQEKVRRKVFSRGVWAPVATITQVRSELAAERSTDAHAEKQIAAAQRREKTHREYVDDFCGTGLDFVGFHQRHATLAAPLATAVTNYATPVGSGTEARPQPIPIERRAKASVIAWMRHQTTGYDSMKIARVKGQRRGVRRMLAERPKNLFGAYKRGEAIGPSCPLANALDAAAQLKGA